MQSVNNILNLIIGKKIARAATAGMKVEESNLANGEVVVTSVFGDVLDDTSVLLHDRIVIVQGQGAGKPLIKSPVIYRNNVYIKRGSANKPRVNQISYLGYNGTSGAISPVVDSDMVVRITRQSSVRNFGNKLMEKFASYSTGATATQKEIALALVTNLTKNWEREPEKLVAFEQTNNGTRSIVPTGAGTLTFTKGSDQVIFGTSITNATGASALAIGDYLTVGAANTNGVYRVTAINTVTNTATIETPFQGVSATILNTDAKFITVANIGANFGIKFTGQDKKFEPGIFKYDVFRFKLSSSGMGSTPVTYAVSAYEGVGTAEQIAEIEWEVVGNEGAVNRIGTPSPTIRKNAEVAPYTVINLAWYEQQGNAILDNNKSFKELMLAFNSTGGNAAQLTTGVTAIKPVLDAWLNTTLTVV